MKKVLTLILSVFAIFSMNAQEKYVAIERNAETGAYTLSKEFKAVLPLNEDGANAIYYWESPDGTPVEEGGKIEYMNGDGERLNYSNAAYHTICLNGKKGNMNDAPAANSGYMLLTLDEALQAGDIINITAYRNKNADGKNATIQFYFENGAEWADSKSFVNICADENDEDYDDDGATPNTHTWEITEAEAGSKTIKLTRNSASTNLFITKLEIIRPPYVASHVTLDKSVTTIEVGQSVTLTATVFPEKPNDVTVSWTTSDANVATVDNGVVKAVGVGTATIKAIAGGKTAECVITVMPVCTVVSTTAESSAPGILKALAVSELKNIVSLKINGTINSYDIIVLNNKMPNLQYLDLENARIVACDYEYRTGYKTEDDVIGTQMFKEQDKYKFIKLPLTTIRIDYEAFWGCDGLTSMVIPNAVTTIGESAFRECHNMSSVVIPKSVSRIENNAFLQCQLTSVDIPSSVRYIGTWAFLDCPLQEVTIPSSVREIGWGAFAGCSNLDKVYTRTVEPTSIDQTTFSVYSTATLYVPKTSYNLYWMDTEWSQFANLVEYDAPYDSFYVSNDYILDDETGNVQGTPDVELEPGSGLVHEGSADQNLGDVHVNANGDVSASIIGNGNVNIENLYLDITINAHKWFFFSFPYKIMLDKIQHPGEYVWRRYDGEKRAANGRGGWSDIVTDCLNQGEGYIYQTNKDGVMSVRVLKEEFGKLEGKDIDVDLKAYASSSANNASWNLLGNPFISYYDIEDLGYDAPITIWNGNSYVAMRPGDDDYILRPFEAFFVQKTKDASALKFKADRRKTYKQAKDKAKKVRMTGIDKQRFIVNLVISDGENSDKTRVVFNEKQNNAYEIGCDAAKFMSTESVPQLYTLDSKHVKYSINERPEGEVAMGYVANKEGQYTISAVRMDKAVMLKDLERGVIHDLSAGDYTFASEAGTFEGRFVLMLNSDVTGIDDIKSQTGVEVAVVNGGISISGAAGKTVTIYNVGGVQVAANVTDGVVALASGTYIVTVDGVSTKVVVK